MTPIEKLAEALQLSPLPKALIDTGDILVPEQCMTVYLQGEPYQVNIQPVAP